MSHPEASILFPFPSQVHHASLKRSPSSSPPRGHVREEDNGLPSLALGSSAYDGLSGALAENEEEGEGR